MVTHSMESLALNVLWSNVEEWMSWETIFVVCSGLSIRVTDEEEPPPHLCMNQTGSENAEFAVAQGERIASSGPLKPLLVIYRYYENKITSLTVLKLVRLCAAA